MAPYSLYTESSAIYTVPVKSLDTPTHLRFFLYLYYFLYCRIIVKTSKHIWYHVGAKRKLLNKSKSILYLRIIKLSPLALMTALLTIGNLNQLPLERFSSSLEEVPTYAEHLLGAFLSLHGPTHPKPSQFG